MARLRARRRAPAVEAGAGADSGNGAKNELAAAGGQRNRRAIACILSDCDGVIVDSEVVAEAVMQNVLRQAFGAADLSAPLDGLIGRRVIDIIEILEDRLEAPLGIARRTALQRTIDAQVAEEAPPMPGTLATYRALGLPVAVVSNSAFPRLYRSVERAGLLTLARDHVYSAEDVGRPKPAPDAYEYAARRFGIPPAACLVVEDSVTGVAAAVAAGMTVFGFLGGSHVGAGHAARLQAAGAIALFSQMPELPELIDRLNRGNVGPLDR